MIFRGNSYIALFRAQNALLTPFPRHIFIDFSPISKTWSGPTPQQIYYEAIRHKVDHFLLTYLQAGPEERATALQALETVSKELDKVAGGAPTVPDPIYDAVTKKIALNPILERTPDKTMETDAKR